MWSSSPTRACSERREPSRSQIELARFHGRRQTRVIEQSPVRRIDLEGDRPVVLTESAEIVAERVIVAAGGWVKRLFRHSRCLLL